MPYSLPSLSSILLQIGDVIKGPPGWFGPQKTLEGGPVYRGGANPSGFSEPSAGDTSQTEVPYQPQLPGRPTAQELSQITRNAKAQAKLYQQTKALRALQAQMQQPNNGFLSPQEAARPTWQQQYGTPQPGQPSIDTPSMRAAMEAGNARDSELEKFGAGMGLKPGLAQRVFNGLVLEAEKTGAPNPSVNQVKYFLTLLRQKGEL